MTREAQWMATKSGNTAIPQPNSYYTVRVARADLPSIKKEAHALPTIDERSRRSSDDSMSVEKRLLQINHELTAQNFSKAALLLAEQIDPLLDQGIPIAQIQAILSAIPAGVADVSADLFYCTAMIRKRMGDFTEAIEQLNRAQLHYRQANRECLVVRCLIDIARIYSGQENLRLALRYLNDEAKPLIDKIGEIDVAIRAYYLLQMAHLATDIGHLNVSTDYAQQALTLYVDAADLPGQFACQLRIARNFMQCGNYRQADTHMQLVRQYFHIGKLGTSLEVQLLNAEIHLRWYQSQFGDAIRLAQLYLKIADHEQLRNARLYARILMANLYRDSHDYRRAEKWYAETQQIINDFSQTLYQPWLDAQQAWLYLLQDDLDQALLHIARSLQTTDPGQRMSFQVQKAVASLLQERFTAAEKLLQESLTFYRQSGDPLADCAICLYLAYIALKREDSGALLVYLTHIFTCLEQLEIDRWPHWWHPQIVAEVCCQAIMADISPVLVKKIITQQLGQQSLFALTRLAHIDDLDVRQHAQQLIGTITGQNMTVLAHLADGPAKQILQNQIETGQLRADGYLRLERELMTAKQRRQPNATLLAVFALHVCGVRRGIIAEQLDCSVENVRNYITTIYHLFALPAAQFRNREERRQGLAKLARERGYIH